MRIFIVTGMAVGIGRCSPAFDVHSLHETRIAREFHIRDENVPRGLDAIYEACLELYANQKRPQQVDIFLFQTENSVKILNEFDFRFLPK